MSHGQWRWAMTVEVAMQMQQEAGRIMRRLACLSSCRTVRVSWSVYNPVARMAYVRLSALLICL